MKKFLLAMIFAVSLLPKANAQEGPETIIYLNLGYTIAPLFAGLIGGGYGFGLGADFERYITDYFTIGGSIGFMYSTFDFGGSSLDFFSVDAVPEWRLYPMGTATRGFFLAAKTGYEFLSIKYESIEAISHIFRLAPLVGYKFILGDSFLLEISGGWEFDMGTINLPNNIKYNYNSGGFTYGIAFGWGW
ncbi:hypothetical protein AGMMS50212_14880 [Spirochaetia bacterium]|nr:hypothetical protein AGMMS50212_14880 [Spirochaetia bacterium]